MNNKIINSKLILKEIKNREINPLLPLGLDNFDKPDLSGGFCSSQKYIIFGANKTGKTQLCYQICIQAFKLFSKGIDISNTKFVYYLDTENTFRPERIKEIAIALNINFSNVFKTINVAKIMSHSALLLKLKEIEMLGQLGSVRVLIIDSINNYFRAERGNKGVKTTFLKILEKIEEITVKFNLITIITSQIAPNFIKNAIIGELPVGNQFLNHFFSEYIYLCNKNNKNYIHLLNSHFFAEKKIYFKITSKGIESLS